MQIPPKHTTFLIYDNRSGSTWLSSLLERFEDVGVTTESGLLFQILAGPNNYRNERQIFRLFKLLARDRQFPNWNISHNTLADKLIQKIPLSAEDLFQCILQEYFSMYKPSSEHWLYKGCDPEWLGKVRKIFSKPKFIFIYRDGRAGFSSKKRTYSPNLHDVMEKNPIRAANCWIKYLNLIDKLNNTELLKVKYENLVEDIELELPKIYQFATNHIGRKITLDKSKTVYQNRIPEDERHAHLNLGKRPIRSRINAWQKDLTFEEIFLYEHMAHTYLRKLGYGIKFYGKPVTHTQKIKLDDFRDSMKRADAKRFLKRLIFYIRSPKLALWKFIFRMQSYMQ